jgi:hypothetical protein
MRLVLDSLLLDDDDDDTSLRGPKESSQLFRADMLAASPASTFSLASASF